MDYEFHVGDYVETNDGTIGYISSVLATGDAWWMCTSDGHGYHAGQEYGIMHNGDFPHRYNRIGQYAFTKPKQLKEIEFLPESWLDTPEKLKINEMVAAMNELYRICVKEE